MPATLREVLKTNTFEQQRQIINTLAQDVYDITELGSTVSLLDGTLTEPSLFFSSDEQLGFYKSGTDQISFVSNGVQLLSLSNNSVTSSVDFNATNANISSLTTGSITVGGSDFTAGVNFYDDLTTYSGKFSGIITSGFGYPEGFYENIPLTGGSGSGATANITVTGGGISGGSISNVGTSYGPGLYENIELTGGSGTGAVANITVGTNQDVSSVVITNFGENYQVGDNLTADFGGGFGFVYNVTSISSAVTSVEIVNYGESKYSFGDELSAEESNFGIGPYDNPLNYRITSFLPHVQIKSFDTESIFDGNVVVKNSVWLASNNINEYVAIGFDPETNLGDPNVDGDEKKLEVNGDIRSQGDIKSLGNLVASFGSVTQPSIKFDTDPVSSSLWNRTGFFAEYEESHGKINVVGDEGRISRYSANRTDFYKNVNLVTATFEDPTIQTGSNYDLGNYIGVQGIGGSGSGLELDLTIAFEGNLVESGAGYTDGSYENIPLIYSTLPGGSVETTTNLVGGSNFIDGSYTEVPLSGGTGNFATANIVVSSGSVTSISILNGGSGYTVGDSLSADASNLGGYKLSDVNISSGGSNYTDGTYNDVILTSTGSLGQNATANVVVSGGSVQSVTVVNGGSGYEISDTLTVDTTSFDSIASYTFNVEDASSPTSFTFTGDATGEDPTITVNKNDDITFNVNTPGDGFTPNPFYIVSELTNGSYDGAYIVGNVVNNGATSGTITWTPNIAGTYYYISSENNNLQGVIEVLETSIGNGCSLIVSDVIIGSGFFVDVATTGTSSGGTGALANITISGGSVQEIVIVEGGSGYDVLDELTVNYLDLIFTDAFGGQIVSVEPTTDFIFRITNVGSVSVTEVSDFGNGYEEGDIITLPISFRPIGVVEWKPETEYNIGDYVVYDFNLYQITGSGISGIEGPSHTIGSQINGTSTFLFYGKEYYYQFGSANYVNSVEIDVLSGQITSEFLKVNSSLGINVNDSLSISDSSISKSTSGNLQLTAIDYVQVTGSSALLLPSGTTEQRPGLTAGDAGAIRYNTSESRFEGYNGSFFVSLGGVRDVDGNTYISAELNPGDDDNTLRFVNDDVQSMQVEQTKITLQTIANIDRTNIDGVTEWEAGASATAPADPINDPPVLIYYEDRVYSVDTTGTFDASTPPTHTTGTVTNGDVDLTYIRSIYGSLTYTGTDLNLTLDKINLNTNGLRISSDNTVSAKLITEAPDFIVGFTNTDDPLLKLSSGGALSINNGFGGTENYIQVLDYELKQFDLKDTRVFSAVGSIDTSVGNAVNLIIAEYDNLTSTLPLHSGKLMIEIIDDSATPRRQYSEISFLAKSDLSDILYTENNKIYSDVELCDISVGIDGSNNITCDIVDLTGSSTTVYSIKVVSQSILV